MPVTGEAPGRGAHVAPQLQAAQRAGGNGLRSRARGACLDARYRLAQEGIRRIRQRRNPLAAPYADRIARAAQLRIAQGHRNTRQVARFAQRGVPALLIEQLFDVGEIAREHARTGSARQRQRPLIVGQASGLNSRLHSKNSQAACPAGGIGALPVGAAGSSVTAGVLAGAAGRRIARRGRAAAAGRVPASGG